MAVRKGNLVVGGELFDNGLMEWDGQSWKAIDLDPTVIELKVSTLGVSKGDLYFGGTFKLRPGLSIEEIRGGIARWDGTDWQMLPPLAMDGRRHVYVDVLRGTNDGVFVGGAFTRTAGLLGKPASCLAKWVD